MKDLSKECKQLLRHHLDSVTSPYSHVCYENNFIGSFSSGTSSMDQFNQATVSPLCLELSDGGAALRKEAMRDQENMPPEKSAQETTPGKVTENRDALRECQMTVPETPSPDQPSDGNYGIKRELGNCVEVGARKRHPRITGNARNWGQNGESFVWKWGQHIKTSLCLCRDMLISCPAFCSNTRSSGRAQRGINIEFWIFNSMSRTAFCSTWDEFVCCE